MKTEEVWRPGEQDHRIIGDLGRRLRGHVLPYFEEQHPEDNRPRAAIAAGRAWARGELAVSEVREAAFSAHAAARDADGAAAIAAARAAGHAAATAHVAEHARHAADYAVKARPLPRFPPTQTLLLPQNVIGRSDAFQSIPVHSCSPHRSGSRELSEISV